MRRGILTLAGLAGLAALASASARWIVWPDTDDPTSADAVVVLAGGGPERLREGRRLVEAGVAPTLVLSHGRELAPDLCDGGTAYQVVCFEPYPDRTQGEARATAALARRRGWERVAVVTSRYHARRAGLLFRRCLGDGVVAVGARPDSPGGLPSVRQLLREWVSYVHLGVVARDC